MASIEWRGENSCRIVVYKPRTTGKGYEKATKTISFPPSMTEKQRKKEAEKAAMLFEDEVKGGKYLDGEKITLTEFVAIWLREYAEKELAPGTLVPYKRYLNKRILPALGHFKLAKIQPSHITSFYNNLTETGIRMDVHYLATSKFLELIEGKSQKSLGEQIGVERHVFANLRAGSGVYLKTAQKICAYFGINMDEHFVIKNPGSVLSATSIKRHHSLLSGLFTFALEWNLIKDNPAKRVRLPSITKAKPAPTTNYYDDEQIANLLIALEDEHIKYRTALLLALDLGLRLSEVAGLTWDMVSIDKQEIDISQQRQYVQGHGIIIGEPKTEKGKRVVTVSSYTLGKLTEYKEHQDKMRLMCGSAWHESDIIITHDDGVPLFPRRPSVWFSDFVKRKGLPHITFHGLRHSNASLMIGGEVDIVTLSGRLGHSNTTTTLNTYAHLIKSRERRAANKIDEFYNATAKNT